MTPGRPDWWPEDRFVTAVLAIVCVQLGFTLIHGVVHAAIPVQIADWQAVYAMAILFALPVVGAGLALQDRVRTGAWVLAAAGIGGFAFESLAHFVVANPDHVATVETWRALFGVTAGLSVVGDLLLFGAVALLLRRHAQGSAATSCIDSAT